jgi:hypothetical protein
VVAVTSLRRPAGLPIRLLVALCAVVVLAGFAAGPAAAQSDLYAYPDGGASSPAGCPQTSTTGSQCTLAQALSLAGGGDAVYLQGAT